MRSSGEIVAQPQSLQFAELPLVVGATRAPHNPSNLPDVLPFELCQDANSGHYYQRLSTNVREVLDSCYDLGLLIGTPLTGDSMSISYIDAFWDFIKKQGLEERSRPKVLEIGAGAGYISRKLAKVGCDVTAIEPGHGYASIREDSNFSVVTDYFPSRQAPGPFDLIVSYCVLEHIEHADEFLHAIYDHLSPAGCAIFAVPDCSEEISAGDPAMLMHEHIHYFTPTSLACLLRGAFSGVSVEQAKFGRNIFAVCRAKPGKGAVPEQSHGLLELGQFRDISERVRGAAAKIFSRTRGQSVGVYVPSRAVNVLPLDSQVRLFDDAPYYEGLFHPPFAQSIEPRASLLENPVEELWIMSRTFGARLRDTLAPQLPHTRIFLADDLFDEDHHTS